MHTPVYTFHTPDIHLIYTPIYNFYTPIYTLCTSIYTLYALYIHPETPCIQPYTIYIHLVYANIHPYTAHTPHYTPDIHIICTQKHLIFTESDLDLVLFRELLSRSAMLVRENKHWRKRGKTNVIWTGLYHFLFPVISISASSSFSFIEHLLVVYGHARMIRKSDLC